MSNANTKFSGTRITSLLDANSFVEIGQSVTARNTDFNMTEKKHLQTVLLPDMVDRWKSAWCTARMFPY